MFWHRKNNLKKAVEGIRAYKIKGCNVTIPYKVEVIKYLDEVDKNSLLIGAVNTIKNEYKVCNWYCEKNKKRNPW